MFDNYANAQQMENHLEREEVQQALEKNIGFATRYSSTLNKEVIYYATRLAKGDIIRFARTNDAVYAQFGDVLQYCVLASLLLLTVAFIVARKITANVLAPLETFDLEHPQKAKAYPELRPILRRLANQQQMRREFSANVSHELKTPLQSVLGYSEIMLNGLVKPEDQKRFMQKIYDEAKNLLQLIDDIIRLSKLDEQQKNYTEHFNLREVIANVMLRLQNKADQNSITLKFESSVNSMPVIGSKAMLEEVFSNLIDNAIKYNCEGGSVIVSLEETPKKWVISISDTGIGIEQDEQERIFERFYRVDKSRHCEGTGLGLSIVKHGVMIHRGSISVRSALGSGTVIVIKLPKIED
ncbi:MAG: HAMP domain-containing histidine kinase [Phascolarctobacterium sp.]|nr:HAMP domain-containing histidine kinase [Phascolarctobacterium sp.]